MKVKPLEKLHLYLVSILIHLISFSSPFWELNPVDGVFVCDSMVKINLNLRGGQLRGNDLCDLEAASNICLYSSICKKDHSCGPCGKEGNVLYIHDKTYLPSTSPFLR